MPQTSLWPQLSVRHGRQAVASYIAPFDPHQNVTVGAWHRW
jgi:hypothetical protein